MERVFCPEIGSLVQPQKCVKCKHFVSETVSYVRCRYVAHKTKIAGIRRGKEIVELKKEG